MAVRATTGPIPENAVRLDKRQVIDYQMKQILSWPSYLDVWPYRFGLPMLSLVGGITSLKINNKVRQKLKLRTYGQAASYLALGVTPALFCSMPHIGAISCDIFLNKFGCPLCIQTKAAMLQVGAGVVYPIIVAPVVNFLFVNRHATYRLPDWTDPKGHMELWWTMMKPLRKKLLIYAAVNAIVAGLITYSEITSLTKIKLKMMLAEDGIEMT